MPLRGLLRGVELVFVKCLGQHPTHVGGKSLFAVIIISIAIIIMMSFLGSQWAIRERQAECKHRREPLLISMTSAGVW